MDRLSSLLALALIGLPACTPTVRVAEPDLVMKSAMTPDAMQACLAYQLGRQFGDPHPEVKKLDNVYRIAIAAPRGGLLGFAEVEQRGDMGSRVLFYDGDLYWPDRQTSGVFPDIARDNWHRAERAFFACDSGQSAG